MRSVPRATAFGFTKKRVEMPYELFPKFAICLLACPINSPLMSSQSYIPLIPPLLAWIIALQNMFPSEIRTLQKNMHVKRKGQRFATSLPRNDRLSMAPARFAG